VLEPLIKWFEKNQRPLPWRTSYDPYQVWVSEVMLQQTQVETALPYFERFVREFPSVDALAKADEERVLKLWAGLGYYRRAKNLIAAAREIDCQIAVERAVACGMGTCQSCCIRVRKPDASKPPLVGRDWCYRLACTDGPVFRGADLLW